MEMMDLAIAMLFLTQTVTGILANIVLLFHYLSLCFSGYRFKPTDLIAVHLIIANTVIMLSKGVSQTVQAFGIMYFSQIIRCRILLYVYRVARSVSVSTTGLLSVFQNVKISSMKPSWNQLKVKFPKHIGFSILLIWVLSILVNCIFPLQNIRVNSSKNITKIKGCEYYPSGYRYKIIETMYSAFVLFPEVLCSGLMLWSSGSMVFILHRHKQQMQHIHKTKDSQKSFPESRATKSILALVCAFVSFHTLSSFFYVCVANLHIPNWWFMNTSTLISTSFPTASPFLLMRCDSTASRLWLKFSAMFRSV